VLLENCISIALQDSEISNWSGIIKEEGIINVTKRLI
jgi:hypothetical protein